MHRSDFDKRGAVRGGAGLKVNVATNLFQLTFPEKQFVSLEQYCIAIFDNGENKAREQVDLAAKLRRKFKREILYAFWGKVKGTFKGNMAYDGGKTMFTSPKFTDVPQVVGFCL
jgi:hypothetical protein